MYYSFFLVNTGGLQWEWVPGYCSEKSRHGISIPRQVTTGVPPVLTYFSHWFIVPSVNSMKSFPTKRVLIRGVFSPWTKSVVFGTNLLSFWFLDSKNTITSLFLPTHNVFLVLFFSIWRPLSHISISQNTFSLLTFSCVPCYKVPSLYLCVPSLYLLDFSLGVKMYSRSHPVMTRSPVQDVLSLTVDPRHPTGLGSPR